MSKTGEYLDTVKNQQLGHYTRWNYKNKQFAYSAYSNSVYAISITDIEGTFRKQYTNSHYDIRPVWGPGNTIILFNRQTEDNQKQQLYLVDTVTGNVQQYIDPAAINGADQIIDAAY
jgi:Tol biopolymer transport system component